MKSFLMTPDNAQKCYLGTKVQTRRLIKPQPDAGLEEFDRYSQIIVGKYHPTKIDRDGIEYPGEEIFGAYTSDGEWGWECPYSIGEQVYIRETWFKYGDMVLYRADGEEYIDPCSTPSGGYHESCRHHPGCEGCSVEPEQIKWRPSIHMPEWAARTIVTITDIRAQRVQDISEDDAIAEGVGVGWQMNAGWPDYQHIRNDFVCELTQDTARLSFASLWDSIHGEGSWTKNEWVFAYSFRRNNG